MKIVKIKSRADLGQDGQILAYHSWAEQMLLDKLSKYHLNHNMQEGYDVVVETDKAVKVCVKADDLFFDNGNYWSGHDFEVWLPKSACLEV